jgi:hypothetical protein
VHVSNPCRADGAEIPVTNGMAVTVEVKTGQRLTIDYIFSPLVEVASTGVTRLWATLLTPPGADRDMQISRLSRATE